MTGESDVFDSVAPADDSVSGRSSRVIYGWSYFAPIALFYAVFLIAPYAAVLVVSFRRFSSATLYTSTYTFDNYLSVLTDRFYLSLLLGTIALGVAVTLLTLVLGYPLALRIVRSTPRMKAILLAIALSPLLINLVVRTYAWLVLLGDHGIVNNWLMALSVISSPLPISGNVVSVTIGLVHVALPLMILSLVGIMERIDPDLLDAAESLGAAPLRILRRVHFPLALPGVGAGSLLVFCFTISAFVTPQLLGGHRYSTIATVIFEKFTFSLNWPLGAALVFVLLALNFAVILLHGRIFREA
ncbi:MAG TPA: ABC transporter permease [Stellaceae bacterium]|nr:ABC transporter permease [Stellaceae bacterium]